MEVEKRFFALPAEILSILTQFLIFDDISRLLMVGNGRLTSSLLQRGAVTELKVVIPSTPLGYPKPWPSLLNCLNSLRSLKITCFGHICPGLDPNRLPSTLTHLELRGSKFFLPFCDKNVFNMAQILPNLHKFESDIDFTALMMDWVSTWPKNLISLQIGYFSLSSPMSLDQFSQGSLPLIPPNLTHLDMSMVMKNDFLPFLIFLPSTLESLRLHASFDNDMRNTPILHLIPRGITALEVRNASIPEVDDFSSLPPNLTSLSLEEVSFQHLFNLPSSLKRLSINTLSNAASSQIPTGGDFMAALPRGLTNLSIKVIHSKKTSRVQGLAANFPPALRNLSGNSIIFGNEASLLSLPSATLSHLDIDTIFAGVKSIPSWPHLRTLKCEHMPLLPKILDQLALNSRFLESIYISHGDVILEECTDSIGRYESHIDPRAIARHAKVESLFDEFDVSKGAPRPISRFSRCLKRVVIRSCDYVNNLFIKDVLPDSIEVLQIWSGYYLYDVAIQSLSSWTNLTSLVLGFSPYVTGASFKYLPRHLKLLNAPECQTICDQDIADLPRSLTDISLDAAIHLTNACIPSLPPAATRLKLKSNKNMTQEILGLLPIANLEKNIHIVTNLFGIQDGSITLAPW